MYSIITNQKNWIESLAIDQVKALSNLPFVTNVVGLPDLHPGKTPVGVSVLCDNYIYPHIIGNDIGCGMGFFDTNIKFKKFVMEKWVSRLNNIKELCDIEYETDYDSPILDLGTIGGGNHFVEFQIIEKVFLKDEFQNLIKNRDDVFVLVHSGSRGYGQKIFSEFSEPKGFSADSFSAKEYLLSHDDALFWAEKNREIVADKLINYLGFSQKAEKIIDCQHNYIEKSENIYIHRKGAVSNTNGYVIIPGSRGSLTYIVKPAGDFEKTAYSLSHGAGRKWARSLCKGKISDKYNRDSIRQTDLKSRVVCHNTELLYKEAPEVYKNIGVIMDILKENELIEIVATLRPLITYKG